MPAPDAPPTARQLRMARRMAQRLGMTPASDDEAIEMLKARGADPFGLPAPAMLVSPPGQAAPPAAAPLPSAATREREVMDIRRDIARRRRRRGLQLLARLTVFVFLPTLAALWYYARIATPLYATRAEFVILQADAATGPLGGIFAGTQFATNQDSIAVQSYLQSMDAMLRLDRDLGFRAHFSQASIDPIQRLPAAASNETVYGLYRKRVEIGYDPTEGVVKMEVSAVSPAMAAAFATHLIRYAEERVDELSARKRADAMRAAEDSLEQARAERREAQQRLVTLQEGSIVDPEAVIGGLRAQINTVEVELQQKGLHRQALLANPAPNDARLQGLDADMDRLRALLANLNTRMTHVQSDDGSLARTTSEVQMAQQDLATAEMFLQSALQNEKQAALEANRQVRYLTTSVRPVMPQDPSYPRVFENTLLVLLVLSGAYLMISLTSAILREQVSG